MVVIIRLLSESPFRRRIISRITGSICLAAGMPAALAIPAIQAGPSGTDVARAGLHAPAGLAVARAGPHAPAGPAVARAGPHAPAGPAGPTRFPSL
jgi:hypothetical protein